VSQILGGKEPEDKRLLKALELLTRWVQADAGMILVVDPRSGKKEAEVSLDLSRPVLDQVRRFLQKQIQGARGPLLFLAGSEDMILLDSAGKTPGSALVVPLRAGEHLLGGLYLERGSEREYLGPRQVTLALAFADVVSLALHGFYFERRLREHLSAQVLYQEIITQNQQMQEIIRIIEKVKDSSATVLILGESGTGKELVARALHKAGKRGNGPFVAVNCSAIPETLLESELFGCVRGAYTGADRDRRGLFEQANGGTIFLDEIAETTPAFQSKLLRVLEEKAIRPVGGNQERPVNVRVVCATNKDLRQETTEGRFRQDLFYRLSVVPLSLPPLRERREDIPLLARHFLEKYAAQEGVEVPDLSSRLMREFLEYDWPGNVRELENVIRRLVSMGDEESIELPRGEEYRLGAGRVSDGEADRQSLFAARRRIETEVVLDALHRADGNKTEAARLLGISRTALYKKLKVLDIEAS
jgi:two-component system response regulator AtoC